MKDSYYIGFYDAINDFEKMALFGGKINLREWLPEKYKNMAPRSRFKWGVPIALSGGVLVGMGLGRKHRIEKGPPYLEVQD